MAASDLGLRAAAAQQPARLTVRARGWPALLRRLPDPPPALAPAIYLVAAVLMFGLPVTGAGHHMVGFGGDPQIFIWALGWWPHALVHGLNAIYSHAIYYPQGLDLAHGALIPAAAMLLSPVTALFGAVTAYNVGMVLSPVLAACFAFLLCRRLTGAFWAAAVGGWLFGFSPYLIGQMAGHLHLTLVFMIPAIVHLCLAARAGEGSRRWLAALLALALTVQFYISAEVFVSFTLFGAVAIVIAFGLGDADERLRLRELLVVLAWSYGGTAVLAAPYLYEAFKPGQVPVLPARGDIVSADFLSYLIPSQLTWLGGNSFAAATQPFTEGPFEGGAYLGLPLIAIAWMAARERFGTLGVRVALLTLVVVIVASFGGHLHVDGAFTIPLPWALVNDLPVIGQLLPARFSVYVFLIVSMLASVWLADAWRRPWPGQLAAGAASGRGGPWRRALAVVLAAGAIVFAWPALATGTWNTPTGLPPLFQSNAYTRYVSRSDVVLVLPIGGNGPSMLWQAVAHFRFPLAGGYALPPEAPNPYSLDPLYPDLNGTPAPNAGPATISFLARHGVTLVLMQVGAPTTAPWQTFLERLGWRAIVRGGVVLMRRG